MNPNNNKLTTFTQLGLGEKPSEIGTIAFNELVEDNPDPGPTLPPVIIQDQTKPSTTGRSTFSKEIEVIDVNGNPLPSVHVTTPLGGTITNAMGIAIVNVSGNNDLVNISHTGKKTFKATFENLGSLNTLQDQPIVNEEVVITSKPKEEKKSNNKTLWLLGAGALGLFLLGGQSSGKKGLKGVKRKPPKPKNKRKSRKTRKKRTRNVVV